MQHTVGKECPEENILSWPRSSLKFFCNMWETQMNVLVNPVSSLTTQLKPNPVRIVPFQVTNAHNSIRSLQEKGSDSPSFLPFQRNTWTPGKPFYQPQVLLIRLLFLALECHVAPTLSAGSLGCQSPCPVNHQAGTYFLTTGTQSWLWQLASQTSPCQWHFSLCPASHHRLCHHWLCWLSPISSLRSWEQKGHLSCRHSVAQSRSSTLLFLWRGMSQAIYLFFHTDRLDSFIHVLWLAGV